MYALQCNGCGMKFWSMIAEARHRHNFPALCRWPKKSKSQISFPSGANSGPARAGEAPQAESISPARSNQSKEMT